jgi:peptidoglycan/xylan/chitin deacetylase (PgdA/CDA1 family)
VSGRALARAAVKGALRRALAGLGGALPLRRVPPDAPRVLCYHGVCAAPPDEWSVTPANLRRQMRWIAARCHPVPLGDLVRHLKGVQALPARAVAVTFDDGLRDTLTTAAPILAELAIPATAFVPPALIDGRPPHPSYAPTRPFLRWGEVRELQAAGWTLGSHTLTHPVLSALPVDEARRELVDSRRALEQQCGSKITLLAYPYGTRRTVSPREQRLAAAAGYEAAFLDMTGALVPGGDLMALPRNKVLGTDSLAVVAASVRGHLDGWRLIEEW